MRRTPGDVLIRGERELRPSEAFIRVIYNELPPQAYPEAAIEELRRRCRRAYREKTMRWWRPRSFAHGADPVATVARLLTEIIFFVATPPTCRHIDVEPSMSVALARALGSASAIG